jgi:hypothetical protein
MTRTFPGILEIVEVLLAVLREIPAVICVGGIMNHGK